MIELKDIEQRLADRRRELAVLRAAHDKLVSRLQNELQASLHAFQQLTGRIIELEELKRLAGSQEIQNGETEQEREREHGRTTSQKVQR